MKNEDKATTTIKDSPAQEFIRTVDKRDKVIRVIEVVCLLALALFSLYTSIRLQYVIDQNNAATVDARQANVARQDELKDYIKCVLLIRYVVPPEDLADYDGAEEALDTCARNTGGLYKDRDER